MIRDDDVQQIALDREVTADRIEELIGLGNEWLARHLDRCMDSVVFQEGGRLVRINGEAQTYVFALGDGSIWETLASELETSEEELAALREFHDRRARTLAIEQLTDRDKSDDVQLTTVPFPANFALARELLEWELIDLAGAGLSPAEMIDWWFTDRQGMEPVEWAGIRGVNAPAVRKNRRAAREVLGR